MNGLFTENGWKELIYVHKKIKVGKFRQNCLGAPPWEYHHHSWSTLVEGGKEPYRPTW